jgi:hypothetical protein
MDGGTGGARASLHAVRGAWGGFGTPSIVPGRAMGGRLQPGDGDRQELQQALVPPAARCTALPIDGLDGWLRLRHALVGVAHTARAHRPCRCGHERWRRGAGGRAKLGRQHDQRRPGDRVRHTLWCDRLGCVWRHLPRVVAHRLERQGLRARGLWHRHPDPAHRRARRCPPGQHALFLVLCPPSVTAILSVAGRHGLPLQRPDLHPARHQL